MAESCPPHRYILPSSGLLVTGVCACGATREFDNAPAELRGVYGGKPNPKKEAGIARLE